MRSKHFLEMIETLLDNHETPIEEIDAELIGDSIRFTHGNEIYELLLEHCGTRETVNGA